MSENKGFYQQATYLGQHFRISRGILKRTACMAEEERLLIADLEAIKKVFPYMDGDKLNSLTMPQLIDKILMPFIEGEGFAKWQRDVVTDMAIKKGDTTKGAKWRTGEEDKDAEVTPQ